MQTKSLDAIDSGHSRPSENPDRQLAAAVVYQALEDVLSSNSERCHDARMFLFSAGEEYRIVRDYWLGFLDLQPCLIERLSSLNQEQLRARLRHAARRQRRRRAA